MSTPSGQPPSGSPAVKNPAAYKNLADVLPSPTNVAASSDENWGPQPTTVASSSRFAGYGLPLSTSDYHGHLFKIIEAVEAQIRRGLPVDFGTLTAVLDAIANSNGIGIDDRKFLLEKILVFLSRIPAGLLGTRVEHFLLDLLYKDLPHPPSTFLAPLVPSTGTPLGLKFAYREADGSNNSPFFWILGASHTPYARSVASSHVAPQSTLPDPAIVFDTLMKRDKEVEHPTGFSSLFFAFANLIIHSLFRTNHKDWRINDTSSYLDLSPLYGVDQKEQNLVRQFNGTGLLWDDTFADPRLVAMPPSVSALLVVFNRNHNFIANRIFEINEGGTYKAASSLKPSDLRAQDDEIFNRARLVNCGTFMQVIMRDYVGSILRMIPDLSPWHLSPFEEFRGSDHQLSPMGQGNACSIEFNLLYRWHATTSATDTKWLEAFWKKLFPNKGYDEVSPREFAEEVGKLKPDDDVRKWRFGGLERDPVTNRFDDGALADILQNATAESANAFRARGTPAVFKVIEVLGIMQARAWGSCSLNEFRHFLDLKRYSSFKEWNPNPEIHEAAERLYHDIDNLELYVGMQSEETRPSIPGSGLCSGFTMSRAILADALALIRGDRFLTVEYTPFNLTSWGFNDAHTDDNNGSFGGMLTKLLLRALPRHYQAGSAYAHFPFIVPKRMRDFMLAKDSDMVSNYSWYRPTHLPPVVTVNSYAAVKEVVTETTKFAQPYEAQAASLTNGYGFYLGSDDTTKGRRDRAMIERALFTPEANIQHAKFFHDVTKELIADKSLTFVGMDSRTVDIVAHVINYIPVHWAATRVAGLSLKTKETPQGKHSEQELYSYIAVIFTYIYLNPDSVKTWFLERNAHHAADVLLKDIQTKIEEFSSLFSVRGIADALSSIVGRHNGGHGSDAFLRHLCQTNSDRETSDLVYNIFGVIVNSVANWAHAMTHVVNFYLDDERKEQKAAIVALALCPLTEKSERSLVGYAKEALRLDPPVAGVFRNARAEYDVSGTNVHAGQTVAANLASAYLDSNVGAGASSQLGSVVGAHSSPDEEFSSKTMAYVLHAIYSKKNIRRAAGASGQLSRFTSNMHNIPQKLYIDTKGQTSRWPQSLLLQFDI